MHTQSAAAHGSIAHSRQEGYRLRLDDGRQALIRRLRPEDHVLYSAFSHHVTGQDHRLRFFTPAGGLAPDRAWHFTHYDPSEARAYIAVDATDGSMLGVARVHRTGGADGEFAVLVRSDLKGLGLGRELIEAALGGAAELGLQTIWGLILQENTNMLALCRELGFGISSSPGDPGVVVARRPVTLS